MANEQAIPRDGVGNLRTLKMAHAAEVAAGEIIVVGDNVLVAVNEAEAAAENIYIYRGRVGYPKATGAGSAIAAGTKVYWDAAAGVATINDGAGANKQIGISVEAAGEDDAEVLVMMHEN